MRETPAPASLPLWGSVVVVCLLYPACLQLPGIVCLCLKCRPYEASDHPTQPLQGCFLSPASPLLLGAPRSLAQRSSAPLSPHPQQGQDKGGHGSAVGTRAQGHEWRHENGISGEVGLPVFTHAGATSAAGAGPWGSGVHGLPHPGQPFGPAGARWPGVCQQTVRAGGPLCVNRGDKCRHQDVA